MAELVVRTVPFMEMVRMVNSGTEATMSAIRLVAATRAETKLLSLKAATTGTLTPRQLKRAQGR